MLYLNKIYKDFGTKTILDNASLIVYDGEKIGIIGNNGQGKTTLLNIIAGGDKDYSGNVKCDEKIAYLKQSSFTEFDTLTAVLSTPDKSQLLLQWLKILNFTGNFENIEKLSCGERTKLAIALAYVENPQILLLDEPTNHLDLTGRQVLTNIINQFNGIVILVSHDIDFLNDTCNKIVKIENGKLEEFFGNYDCYLEEYNKKQLAIKREYEAHTKRVKEIEDNIDKIKRFAKKSERDVGRQDNGNGANYMTTKTKAMVHAKKMNKTVASRISKLEQKLDKAPEKPADEKPIKYNLDANPLKTKIAAKFQDVSFAYETKLIFQNLNFEILSNQRVGLIGDNGCGKSTLIKLIQQKLTPNSGSIFVPQSVKISTMEQDIYDLDEEKTIEQLSLNGDNDYRRTFITNLVNMNIDKSRFNTKIKNLSLGERMRIKLNFIILSDANFIILDEPTNHLDIENKEFLQKVLSGFNGTILIISHDLKFIKSCCDIVYKICDKKTINITL